MRLINVYTMEVANFPRQELPIYAILSHTWAKDEEELTFGELGAGKHTWQQKAGGNKVKRFCELMKQRGIQYTWVDTCCIDQSSSAEASEAINSMFRIYREAAICVAYLQDIAVSEWSNDTEMLSKSRWFTRGWTLQELIAPPEVWFYDQDWRIIGEKCSDLMLDILSKTTRICHSVLRDGGRIYDASIATRLSWAAGRQTSRVEDIAYCLLGICDVNMPIIYGEGPSAFRRLQEEFIRSSDDTSIFAWTSSGCEETRGLLAKSPDEFLLFSEASFYPKPFMLAYEYTLTNKGLRVNNPALFREDSKSDMIWALMGQSQDKVTAEAFGISIREVNGIFVRTHPQKLLVPTGDFGPFFQVIYLKMHERRFDTSRISSVLHVSDLEMCRISNGYDYLGSLQTNVQALVPKDSGWLPHRNIEGLSLAGIHKSHTTPHKNGNRLLRPGYFPGVHDPDADIMSCIATSQVDENNTAMSDADSVSFCGPEEEDISVETRESS
ncbi:hypothetical protein PG994_002544 [Apiospora phragmitis]|uniref:Heterokaryon incompatibility domain-containing protein n=1 Tax=Apiospora phragmitis TaxID=2905665 RepID=A0ABR1W5G5_9PEZI